jgi:hypothetical protein
MPSPPEIHLTSDAVEVRLRGLAAMGALRRRVRVPYDAIESVEAGTFPMKPRPWRLGGYALGQARFGRFRRDGRWLFLAFTRPEPVLILRCDRERAGGWDEVVVESQDAQTLARQIAERLPARDRAPLA